MTGLEAERADLFGLEQQSSDGLHPEEGSGDCVACSHGIKVFDSNRAELRFFAEIRAGDGRVLV